MTSFHLFQSIFNSAFEFYGLSHWLLEPMPDNVDLSRCQPHRSRHGWTFYRHNARAKFVCRCSSSSKVHQANTWISAYTTILFRARLDRAFNGEYIGRIQMKPFGQSCQLCNSNCAGLLDETEIKKTFYRLYIWILKIFYQVTLADDHMDDFHDVGLRQKHRGQVSHDSSRCDGCRIGWCKYLHRSGQPNQASKRHTMIMM